MKSTPGARPRLPDLASLQELVERLEKAPPAPPKQQVVLIVHGTFAGSELARGASAASPSEVPWWKSYSTFAQALDAALARYGSAARCSESIDEVLERGPRFARGTYWGGWSGANSEVERRQGAYRLAEHIRALQRNHRIGTYHIVAHSHGGNVARRALRYLREPTHKRGVILCLGTPFLHFADRAIWRRWVARIHWPMLLVLALLAWGLVTLAQRPDPEEVQLYALTAVAVGALVEMWRYGRSSEINSIDPQAVAVRFARDEAIRLLRSCSALVAEPHLFLRDVLGGAAPRRPWQRSKQERPRGWYERTAAVTTAFGRALVNAFVALSNIWNGPICRAAETVTSLTYRLPFLGSLSAFLLILGFRPYRPPLRPFLASRMPRLSALFFHSFEKESARMVDEAYSDLPATGRAASGGLLMDWSPTGSAAAERKPWWRALSTPLKGTPFDPDTANTLVAGAAALLYFALYPIDKLLGLPAWLGAVMTRFAILVGARAAASGATGMDMLGAAFRPRETGRPPEGVEEVTVPEALEADIEQRLGAAGRVDVKALRDALDPAKRAMLMQAIETAFTDVGLLHAQYYQDPRIIDYLARRIAGQTAPEWPEDVPAEAS